MIDLIKNIFTDYGYRNTELGFPNLTLYEGSSEREEYWLVAKIDSETDVVQEQQNFFDKCASHIDNPALEKNTSLLIVWETSGYLPLESLKKKIMQIEEDAYFFKKYVLHYAPQQKEALQHALGEENSLKEFLSEKIIDQEIFKRYKNEKIENSHTMTWESLIYRMAIKIPFISIKIESKNDLGSLEKDNQEVINKEGTQIIELNEKLFSLEGRDFLFDTDTSPENLLHALKGDLNENTN